MSFGYGPARRLLGGGDPEAEGAAQASMAMQPNVLGYAQDVLSGKYAREGVLGQQRAPYDLDRPLRENLPEISQQAMDVALGVGPGAIRAFHGSPHSFGRFDMSKIGTGEGAQAYGHGLYFAEAEPVAESYLRNADWRYGGRKAQTIYDRLNDQASERGLDAAGWDRLNAQRGFWEKVALGRAPRSIIDDAVTNPGQYGPAELSYIQSLDPNRFKRVGGNMYEVDINADPQRLLDWDRPLSGQSPFVQETLSSLGISPRKSSLDFPPGYTPKTMEKAGSDVYRELIDRISPTGLSRLSGPSRVSEQLNEAGIPGISYLDQFSRGSTGPGSSNYVVFNDKLVEILRKYGIVPPLAGAGAMALPGEDGGGF